MFVCFSASIVQSKAGIAVAAYVCDAESRNEVRKTEINAFLRCQNQTFTSTNLVLNSSGDGTRQCNSLEFKAPERVLRFST